MKILLLILLTITLNAQTLKECQQRVFNIAKKYTDYPSTIVGIDTVESSCGKHILGDDSKSLGRMQIQIRTARFVSTKIKKISWIQKLSDKSLQTLLLKNDEFNILIGISYFEYNRKKYGYFQAISRYNGGKNNWTYFNKVQKAKKDFLRNR